MTSEERAPADVVVVGMGYWGRNLVRNFHALGSLAAICDSDPTVEDTCRHEYPGARYIADFKEVLADGGIRAVALATPAVAHFEMAKAAMLAGKDVFVEKPLALEVAQGQNSCGSHSPLGVS